MVSDLEHRNSIVAIMARIEEHDIVVSTIFQFFFNELYQLVHNIAAGNTVAVHTCILVFLPDDLGDRVREMRIIYTIENAVNDQSLALLAFSSASAIAQRARSSISSLVAKGSSSGVGAGSSSGKISVDGADASTIRERGSV